MDTLINTAMLTKNDDVVVGVISHYAEFDKIKLWVNSLNRCGFSGKKVMITYNVGPKIISELEKNNFKVFAFSIAQTFNVVNLRFFHLWLILSKINETFRYVISTDVADVVFQTDPSIFLENNLRDKKLCFGSEGLRYVNEPWGYNNMSASFGAVAAEYMSRNIIYNAGTLAGEYQSFIDFCFNVFLVLKSAPEHVVGGGGPDQAALNLLLSFDAYKRISLLNNHDQPWACQCGTTVDPNKIESFRPNLLSPEPYFDGEFVYTSEGNKYVLVHQYNRVPEWKLKLEKKYG